MGRLLDGIKLVYLEEKVFVQNAKYELDCAPGVLVKASRWDVILLLENLLKNAIEAIVEAKKYGLIAIKLQPGLLTVLSDGGPIKACNGCPLAGKGNCLDCPVFSKGGYTTKKTGSGTGLAQVFSAVRAQKWGIAVECGPDTSSFKISFPVEAAAP
jgi:sensor histidine kinase regulating citrate/malate metabolism